MTNTTEDATTDFPELQDFDAPHRHSFRCLGCDRVVYVDEAWHLAVHLEL